MAGHWYNPNTGSPQHFRADGRPTSLRDARQENLLPSSTTINGIIDKPQLSKWLKEQIAKAAMNYPPLEGEEVEGYCKRLNNLAYKETSSAAEYGTRFHKAAEDYFNGKELDEEFSLQLQPIIEWKEEKGIRFDQLEQPFACKKHGFGGTIDIVASNPSGAKMIIDYKTRKSHPSYPMKPYGPELWQLGSYAVGAYGEEAVLNMEVHAVNIFVSSTEAGRVEIRGYKPEEVKQGWLLFQAISEVWFKIKKYDPRQN
jgi:hypothetical protein